MCDESSSAFFVAVPLKTRAKLNQIEDTIVSYICCNKSTAILLLLLLLLGLLLRCCRFCCCCCCCNIKSNERECPLLIKFNYIFEQQQRLARERGIPQYPAEHKRPPWGPPRSPLKKMPATF